jgi:DeoR/GlpR family transcriptional regulator of sugar metabolism
LTEPQLMILKILKESGGIEFDELLGRLGGSASTLRRELAALRHMEKIRGTMSEGKTLLCEW